MNLFVFRIHVKCLLFTNSCLVFLLVVSGTNTMSCDIPSANHSSCFSNHSGLMRIIRLWPFCSCRAATVSVHPHCVCQSPTFLPSSSSSPLLISFSHLIPTCYEQVMRARREEDCLPSSCWYGAYHSSYSHQKLLFGQFFIRFIIKCDCGGHCRQFIKNLKKNGKTATTKIWI